MKVSRCTGTGKTHRREREDIRTMTIVLSLNAGCQRLYLLSAALALTLPLLWIGRSPGSEWDAHLEALLLDLGHAGERA